MTGPARKSSPFTGRWQREALTEGGFRKRCVSGEPPPPPPSAAVPLPVNGEELSHPTTRNRAWSICHASCAGVAPSTPFTRRITYVPRKCCRRPVFSRA